jgi:hypothetical protein
VGHLDAYTGNDYTLPEGISLEANNTRTYILKSRRQVHSIGAEAAGLRLTVVESLYLDWHARLEPHNTEQVALVVGIAFWATLCQDK